MWIGTWHNGIVKIQNGNEEFLTKENSKLPNNIINRIVQGPNDEIWVATYAGLAKIDGETITEFNNVNTPLLDNYISDIEFDYDGNLWIATQVGLGKFDGSTWKVFTTFNSSIPANFITTVHVDPNNTLWIGTNQFNTSKFDGVNTWTTYQSDELLIGDFVADIITTKDNQLWVGVVAQPKKGKSGGVFILEQDSLVEVNFNLANKRINRFFMDDDQKLWIGTRSGVVSVNSPSDYKLFTANITGLPINDILSIAKDGYGNIWFGTNGGGLVKYKIWKE
jgi:ligand-binding sensor domain-containing protein